MAPEHVSDQVLAMMGKPEHAVYQKFVEEYKKMNREDGKEPVSGAVSDVLPSGLFTLKEAVELAEYLQ